MKRFDVLMAAEEAALYYRTLVLDGVPEAAATQMTNAWIAARILASVQTKLPPEPWE